MVQIGSFPWVNMRHQIQDAVALQDVLAGEDGDVVAGFDGDVGVDLDVRVHHDHVAHFAGVYVMNIANAGGVEQSLANRGDFLLVHGAIHQVV